MGSALHVGEVDAAARACVAAAKRDAVDHVVKLARKIVDNPAEGKFRKLKADSSVFTQRFGSPEAMRLLRAIGFEQLGDRLVLGDGRVDGLAAALARLEAAAAPGADTTMDTSDAGAAADACAAAEAKDEDVVMDDGDADLRAALELSRREGTSAQPVADGDDEEDLRRALALSNGQEGASEADEDEDDLRRALALSEAPEKTLKDRIGEIFSLACALGASPNAAAVAALQLAQAEGEEARQAETDVLTKTGFEARVKMLFKLAASAQVGANDAAARALAYVQQEQLRAAEAQRRDQQQREAQATAAAATEAAAPRAPAAARRAAAAFERIECVESVAAEQLEVINLMYKEDGINFVDPSFPPAAASLYVDATSALAWRCSACKARNPIPPGINTFDEVLEMMRQAQQTQKMRYVACGTCGQEHPLQEVAMRPTDWVRPNGLRDDLTLQTSKVPWQIFRGEPRADDIRQGGVGNCWFVCALSVLADDALCKRLAAMGQGEAYSPLKQLVLTKSFNAAGAYQVRLCRAGEWHTVTVDDTFPVNALGTLAYLKAARRSLWGPLLEKAAAKLHGSYEALSGGTFAEAFHMLTGFPVQKVLMGQYSCGSSAAAALLLGGESAEPAHKAERVESLKKTFDAKFPGGSDEAEVECFAQLYSFKESGFALGASTFVSGDDPKLEAKMRALGLQTRHAYGLLDVRENDGNHLVKLRNPNGVALWKGDWCKDSHSWTFGTKKLFAVDDEDAGVFWMSIGDFLEYFVELTVCRLLPQHLEARTFGWLASAFGAGEAVVIETYSRNAIELATYQEAHASRGEDSITTAVDLGLALIKCDKTKPSAYDGALVASAARVSLFVQRGRRESGMDARATANAGMDSPAT